MKEKIYIEKSKYCKGFLYLRELGGGIFDEILIYRNYDLRKKENKNRIIDLFNMQEQADRFNYNHKGLAKIKLEGNEMFSIYLYEEAFDYIEFDDRYNSFKTVEECINYFYIFSEGTGGRCNYDGTLRD